MFGFPVGCSNSGFLSTPSFSLAFLCLPLLFLVFTVHSIYGNLYSYILGFFFFFSLFSFFIFSFSHFSFLLSNIKILRGSLVCNPNLSILRQNHLLICRIQIRSCIFTHLSEEVDFVYTSNRRLSRQIPIIIT